MNKLETVEEKKDEKKDTVENHPDSTSCSSQTKPTFQLGTSVGVGGVSSPPSLPTIAMADIAVPFSHSVDVQSRQYSSSISGHEGWPLAHDEVVVLPHHSDSQLHNNATL